MKALHLKQLIRQNKPGHRLDSSTVPRIFHFGGCKQMFLPRPSTMQVKRGEQSTVNCEKDKAVLLLPFCNDPKSVLQKQKTTIQGDR